MGFGEFDKITWVNGGSPAIDADNLQRFDNFCELADEELRRSECINLKDKIQGFYDRNINEIENFDDYLDWTALNASTTLSNDTTNNVIGLNAVKMLENDNTLGWIGMYRTITSLDLTKFHDGSASTTDDLIYLLLYVNDTTKFSFFHFKLGTDNTHNYSIAWNPASFTNGWNVAIAQKSDFTVNGAPNWNAIVHVRIEAITTVNAVNSYFTCQYMQMIRQDPDYSGYSNAFQEYMGVATGWQSVFSIYSDWYSIVYDNRINRIGIMQLEAADYSTGLHVYCDVLSFQSRWEIYSKLAGYSPSISWYVDATNYAETYISANVFYLNVVEAGASTSQNMALSNNLLLNEKIFIEFEKNNDTIRAVLLKDGEQLHEIVHETSISENAEGCVSACTFGTSSWGIISDFAVSSNYGDLHIEDKQSPRLIKLNTAQSFVNNTMTNIPDFLFRLKPNKVYKIESFLYAYNASASPDIKFDWDYSASVSQIVLRSCYGGQGLAGSTEPSSSNAMRTSSHNLATDVRYALPAGTDQSSIREVAIVKTSNVAAYMQLRAAQYSTDAANASILSTNSYIIITEIFI